MCRSINKSSQTSNFILFWRNRLYGNFKTQLQSMAHFTRQLFLLFLWLGIRQVTQSLHPSTYILSKSQKLYNSVTAPTIASSRFRKRHHYRQERDNGIWKKCHPVTRGRYSLLFRSLLSKEILSFPPPSLQFIFGYGKIRRHKLARLIHLRDEKFPNEKI